MRLQILFKLVIQLPEIDWTYNVQVRKSGEHNKKAGCQEARRVDVFNWRYNGQCG